MTKISYIHGPIPTDEIPDRAREVQPAPYFNPLVMTEGGAYLTLMRDQVKVLSQYYPENPTYRKGLSLIDNALHKGIHGPMPYLGALEPSLYPIARAIDVFKTRRQPATRPQMPRVGAASWQDESMVAGPLPELTQAFAVWWFLQDRAYLTSIGVKDAQKLKTTLESLKGVPPLVPKTTFEKKWVEYARKYENLKFVTDLYNEKLEKFAHHPLYNFLPQSSSDYPAAVVMKNILHSSGLQGMANQGDFSTDNMSLWTRNSILRANIAGNVGAMSPERSIFELTQLPESELKTFLNVRTSTTPGSQRPGATVKGHIGAVPLLALIPLIAAAIGAAQQIVVAIVNSKTQQNALASVEGWGTEAYAAGKDDWRNYKLSPDGTLPPATTESATNWPLIIGGGGLAAWLLTSK